MNVNGITEAGADVASESIVPKFAPQTLPMYARLQDGHTLEKHPARPKLERQTSSVSLPGYPSANDVIPKTGLSHSYLGLNQEPDPLARMRLWYDSSFADPEATPSGPDEREQKFQGGPKIPSTSQPRGFSKLRTVRSMRGPLGHSTRDLMLRIRRDMRAIPTADGKEAVQTENAVANSELCSQTCQGKPRHSNHSCNEDKKDAIGTVSEKQSTQVCMANVEEKTLLDNGVKENYKKTLVRHSNHSCNEDKKDAIGTVSEKQSTQVCMANVEEKTLLDNGVKENYKKTLVRHSNHSCNEDKKDAIGTVSEKQSTQVCMANVEENTLIAPGDQCSNLCLFS
eukprot:CAMPEP_0114319308 /NCGR_PEP_ID=MMETSP0059-20121206/25167_1 /TAXON_ID=36894 /ORGANISM="Pyramimonas parkeae, Strain CCMP726" /LENGTH=339 /DNA_ID=CAMNT_0001446297 /DNA_START=384 /DNA_END=1403 /DNA_ORIENTATION=-